VRAVVVAVTAVLAGVFAAPSPGARAVSVRITAPASSFAGATCRVTVSVSRALRATVVLQERTAGRWKTVKRKPLVGRRTRLACPVSARAGTTRRFRALLRRGGRTLARSAVVRTRVSASPSAAQPQPAAPPGRPLINPAQFGATGTGGPPSPETLALIANPRVVFDAVGIADLRAGRIDPRLVEVLSRIAAAHVIVIGAMCSDHAQFTAGGAISNHWLGRGADIATIDGVPVDTMNATAREVAADLQSLDPTIRPDEVGSPFAIASPGYFTDADTQDNVHVAFDRPIDPAWVPPPG
jgi:hypothetical protein